MAFYSLLNMEQNKRFELSLPVWKTGVLTINTNSANWSWRKDLNLQLIAYKAITLPLELRQRIYMRRPTFAPQTRTFNFYNPNHPEIRL